MLRIHERSGRIQLRRGTVFGSVVGVAGLLLGIGFLFISMGRALGGDVWGLGFPTLSGLVLGLLGLRAASGGELILDVQRTGTRVAALSRALRPEELRRVEVRWRSCARGSKELEVVLVLAEGSAPLAATPMLYDDPEALGRLLASALKVPAEVSHAPAPTHHVSL